MKKSSGVGGFHPSIDSDRLKKANNTKKYERILDILFLQKLIL